MPTLCTVSGDPIKTGDAVCLAGFDPLRYPFRPVLVAKANAATLCIARSILGIADTGRAAAVHGEPLEVFVGGESAENRENADDELPPPSYRERRRGTATVDVSREEVVEINGPLAAYDTIKLVGDLRQDVHVTVPQEDGWSGRFLDRTTSVMSDSSVRIVADVSGTTVTTTQGATQRVYVEFDGRNFNVRAEAPAI